MTALLADSEFPDLLRTFRMRQRLSQLDLALRANTTQRHISFLEKARSTPGRTMVVRLGEALGLSLRQRNQLLLAAGFAPSFTESTLDDPNLKAVHGALGSILEGHMPYPAVIVRPYGDVVAHNEAFNILTRGVDARLLETPINALRVALHPEGLAPRVVNLAQWGRHITMNLRLRAERDPSKALDVLIEELEGYLPPVDDDDDQLGFSVPLVLTHGDRQLRLITTLSTFATATDVTLAELQLEAFLPADEFTANVLREIADKST
jgi:transcriptional regulator with XRE-family HTH domain